MPFDFAPNEGLKHRGRTSYQDGLAAEDTVLQDYLQRGYRLIAQRWRGRAGEIDLIFDATGTYVFVEVKKARTHDAAMARLSERQLHRIARSAEDYIGRFAADPLTPMRLDLATVDGFGSVSVLENLTLY